ncbi:ABC transporter substrate-binding protein [Rhodobacteraceae bacterium B1Z28]|uniref:ABC transporter substrate-binding protein n=1 Tax=Ruegeria haliotis TaxID=2747601 RepID=A0ABX2PVG6_9RHOB|nr:ABC transporter substrate-binding protein [Ruegeria haliotis]NVO57351.1 ABC transporter substrate-binding protein [Ruegeria haliotis]
MRPLAAIRTLMCTLVLLPAPFASAQSVKVTDIIGRQVTVDGPVKRLVISDFRQIIGLSLIDRNVGNLIVGAGSKSRVGPELRAELEKQFPGITSVPELAENSPVISAEQVIALNPDLLILSDPPGPAINQVVAQLDRAGIPTVFIDFRLNPYENTLPSLTIAAEVLGSGPQAAEFLAFYRQHRDRVVDHAAGLADRPAVLMHLQATPTRQCCMSLGEISLGRFITAAGGRNIGTDIIPGAFAQISPEYVLSHQPDIYIATGGRQLESNEGLIVGPGVSADLAHASLMSLQETPILSDLDAIAGGRSYGLWHSIHNSPLNIVALELLARWIHPQEFAGLDPQQTLDEINARFLPFEFDGAIWTAAKDKP